MDDVRVVMADSVAAEGFDHILADDPSDGSSDDPSAYPSAECSRHILGDEDYMRAAIRLAKRGAGWVNPNPMVGCIIVRGGCVIGAGYHTRFGAPHAEREALADCARRGEDTCGATVYVTLEPCAHTGKTPPCCDALVDADVARVVVGSSDPNPLVAGRGVARLEAAGIEVRCGVLEDECDALNAPFFHFITEHTPYIVVKFACTLDGKVATRTGASRWITGSSARHRVHEDRATYAAIMVGVGTVIADDPLLSARLDPIDDSAVDALGSILDGYGAASDLGMHQPTRIVVDTHLRCPKDAQVVLSATEQPTYIATCVSDEAALAPYKESGCGIIIVGEDEQGHADLVQLFAILGEMGLDSVYVEGGATLLGSLFDARLPNKVEAFIAPKIFGGAKALSAVAGEGVALPDAAAQLENVKIEQFDGDILVSGSVVWDRLHES